MTPRSWLFVPGHQERKIVRAGTSGADAVILDLEDGVPPDAKADGRRCVVDALRSGIADATSTWVRIGAVADGAGWRQDLEALAGSTVAGLVLPKVRGADDVHQVERALAEVDPGGRLGGLVPIVTEQAEGALAMRESLAGSTRIAAAFWGSEDLSADLRATRVKDDDGRMLDVFAVVQGLFLLHCRAAGVPPVDTPFLDLRDPDGLRREAERAHWMGFAGKQVIHPDHVAVVNAAFLPSQQELERATAVVEAFAETGGGALRVDDGMVDPPHLKRARSVLARSAAASVGADGAGA